MASFDQAATTPAGEIEERLNGVILPNGQIAQFEKQIKKAQSPKEIMGALQGLLETVSDLSGMAADDAVNPRKEKQDFHFKSNDQQSEFEERLGQVGAAFKQTQESINLVRGGKVNDLEALRKAGMNLCKTTRCQGQALSSMLSGIEGGDHAQTLPAVGGYFQEAAPMQKEVQHYTDEHKPAVSLTNTMMNFFSKIIKAAVNFLGGVSGDKNADQTNSSRAERVEVMRRDSSASTETTEESKKVDMAAALAEAKPVSKILKGQISGGGQDGPTSAISAQAEEEKAAGASR